MQCKYKLTVTAASNIIPGSRNSIFINAVVFVVEMNNFKEMLSESITINNIYCFMNKGFELSSE